MKYERDENYVSFLDTPRHKKQNEQFNTIVINEDYIKSEYSGQRKKEDFFEPKLVDQLVIKDRQRSSFYNTIVLTFFNINTYHFCFPYITNKIGILLTLIILLICGIYSYTVQSSLIKYISKSSESTDTSFSGIIHNHFGKCCSVFYEVLLIMWYCIMTITCMSTCNYLLK
jgi:hypothetical protein